MDSGGKARRQQRVGRRCLPRGPSRRRGYQEIVPDLTDDEIARTDFGEYLVETCLDDLFRITQYNIDPQLAEVTVQNRTDTALWLRGRGQMIDLVRAGRDPDDLARESEPMARKLRQPTEG